MCIANIQHTIRNIPPHVDRVIRKRAAQTGTSFNQTVVELLTLRAPEDSVLAKPNTVDDFFGKAGEFLDEGNYSRGWNDPGHTRY